MRKKQKPSDEPGMEILDQEGAPNISDDEKLALGNICKAIPVRTFITIFLLLFDIIIF